MQSLPVVIFAAVCCTGESVGTPTNAVFAFEEIHLLFIGVVPLEKYEDTAFTARKAAAVGHGGINLVLGDELLGCRYFRQLSGKGGAGQGQVFQVFPNLSRFVVVEAQQLPVLLVGRPEGSVFFRKGLAELRAVQLLGKPCGFFRKPGPLNNGQTGQIPGFSGFIAEIQTEKALAEEDALQAQQPTPEIWEYNGVKERHPDDMVLYQIGDFFELYGEDAKTAAAELGFNHTTRAIPGGGRVEMCGFPANRLEQVVEQLRDQHDVTISAVPEGGKERQEYSMPSIDHEVEQHIDAQEAEFGADGTRVFRETEAAAARSEEHTSAAAAPTIRELHEQYKPTVLAAVMEGMEYS